MFMLNRHNLPVFRPGGDGQAVRQGVRVRRQGVIPGHRRALRQIPEQRAAGVKFNLGLLSVHQPLRVGDGRAEGGADGLVAQADAQYGNLWPQGFYRLNENPRVLRPAGAGGKDDPLRGQGLDLRYGQFVVPDDLDVRRNGPDELVEVVGKAVVVVNQKNHKSASLWARSRSSTPARALLMHS